MQRGRRPGPCTNGHACGVHLRPGGPQGRRRAPRPRSDSTWREPETRPSPHSTTCRSPPGRARTTRAPRPHSSRRLLRSQAAGGWNTRPPQGARADPPSLMLETARRAVTLHRKLCSQNCINATMSTILCNCPLSVRRLILSPTGDSLVAPTRRQTRRRRPSGRRGPAEDCQLRRVLRRSGRHKGVTLQTAVRLKRTGVTRD